MSQPIVRKVKPYPFSIELQSSVLTQPLKGQVVKMVSHGLLFEVPTATALSPGDSTAIQFELPGLHANIASQAVVVKVFNQVHAGQRIEIHFKGLNPESAKAVSQFLIQTGQAKRVP